MKKIFVNGYGSIGSRIASFLKDDPEIIVIGVGKYSPDEKVNVAISRGLNVYVPERKLDDFLNYKISGSIESALDECDLVIDAAPGGHRYKNKKNLYPKANKDKLKEIIIKCIIHKVDIVQQDEKDLGHRRILNFGHTAGHALESYFNFQISHGVGVLYGMKVAAKISLELNKINKKQYIRITDLIDSFNIKSLGKINIDKILNFMYYDKKSSHNKINYIILKDIGSSTINNNIDVEIIKKGLSSL